MFKHILKWIPEPLQLGTIHYPIYTSTEYIKSCSSKIGIVSGYRPDDWAVRVQVLVGSRIFTSPLSSKLGLGSTQSLIQWIPRVSFLVWGGGGEGKCQGHETNHSPLTGTLQLAYKSQTFDTTDHKPYICNTIVLEAQNQWMLTWSAKSCYAKWQFQLTVLQASSTFTSWSLSSCL
jgi:hypothetical protein